MNPLMMLHIAAGIIALVAGTAAVAARKGGRWHARAGTWFFGSMLVLGVTATPLSWWREDPDPGFGGVFVCYFVLTSWFAARRREGKAGWIEIAACATALGLGALMILGGLTEIRTLTPVGNGPVLLLGALCLLAGLLDLRAALRKLTPAQRIARHLWRMCFAFFIATGSFFLGQQDVLPAAMRGSPAQFILAFAPFGVMAFWLVRVRFGKMFHPARPA